MFGNPSGFGLGSSGGLFGGGARPAGTGATTFGQSSFFAQPQGPTTSFDFVGSTFNTKNRDGYLVASITASINQISLEELRINDHFAMKRNLLPDQKKQNIESIIQNNIRKRDSQPGSLFSYPFPNANPTPVPQTGGGFLQQQAQSGLTHLQAPSGLLGQPNLPSQPPQNLGGPSPQPVFGLSTLPPPTSGGLFGHFNPPTTTSEKSSTELPATTSLLGSTPHQTVAFPNPGQTVLPAAPFNATPQQTLHQTVAFPNPGQTVLAATTLNAIPQQSLNIPSNNPPSNSFFSQPPADQSKPFGNLSANPQVPSLFKAIQEKDQTKQDSFFGANKNPQPQPVTQSVVVNPPKAVVEQNIVQPVSIAPGEFKTQTVSSKPGGFSHEMNKMLFVSSLMELFGEHNIVFPEDLLETTDFMPQLFEFLATYDIKPPQKFVPRFKINKSAVLAVIPPESRDDYREKEAEAQQSQSQQIIQKPALIQKEEEKKEEPKKVSGLEIKTKPSQPVKEESEKDENEESEEREESEKEGSAVVIGESNEAGHDDNQ